MAVTTALPAVRCSSVALAICETSDAVSVTPVRIFFRPAAPVSASALLSSAMRRPSFDALTASCATSCSALMIAGDVGGRLGRAIGQVADLLGDDGEAAAGIAGARRLDRGVQRQQVRPLGDQVDGVDDAS